MILLCFFTTIGTNQLLAGWSNHAHLEPLVQGSSPKAVNYYLSYPTSEKQEHKNPSASREWVCGPLVIEACFGPKTQILSWTELNRPAVPVLSGLAVEPPVRSPFRLKSSTEPDQGLVNSSTGWTDRSVRFLKHWILCILKLDKETQNPGERERSWIPYSNHKI